VIRLVRLQRPQPESPRETAGPEAQAPDAAAVTKERTECIGCNNEDFTLHNVHYRRLVRRWGQRGAAVEAVMDGTEKITRETLDRVGLDHAVEAARTRRKAAARRRRDSAG
jgi:hypothetical protein